MQRANNRFALERGALKRPLGIAILTASALAVLLYVGGWSFLMAAHYMPHRYCLSQSWLIWANVVSDLIISLSYIAIFSGLFWIAHRLRSLPEVRAYLWIFLAFGLFIVACASTHAMKVVTLWWAVYRLSLAFKVVSATASIATAVLFVRAAPEITSSIGQFLETLSTTRRENESGLAARARAETRVKEAEARLQAVLDSVMDSILTVDAQGRILSINPATVKMFGFAAAELLGRNLDMLIPGVVICAAEPSAPGTAAAGTVRAVSIDREPQGLTRAGKWLSLELTISELCFQGEPMFVSQIHDITDRRLAEEARERLAAVVDSSDDAIFSQDFQGIITAWNLGAEKVLGYAESEALGKSARMLMPADRLEEDTTVLQRIRRGERIEHFETVRLRDDGSRIDVSVTLSPVRNNRGVIIGTSSIARDITERKRSELIHAQQTEQLSRQAQDLLQSQNALETQQALLESVLDSIGEGLIAADKNGKFILWNPAAERLIGGPAALNPLEWSAYYGSFLPDKVTPFPPDQVPLFRALCGETCSSEIFIRRRGGDDTVWLECNAAPLYDKDGSQQGGVIALRDITQRKTDEENIAKRTLQLEVANQELEAFTYTVSHDLRAPLRHIGSFAGILMEDFGAGLNTEATGHLRRIQDAARRMGELVDGLLGMAKLGRQSLRLRPTPLDGIVKEAIANLEQECEGREVEWRVGLLPALACDQILMAQVFQNLLDNALKYTRGRKPAIIEIGCTQATDKPAVIFVRDNGVGFDLNYAENLFGVFQRMHSSSEFEGTGVGLAATQRIVQKHGGAIWVDAHPNQGATFFFTLEGDEQRAKSAQALVME